MFERVILRRSLDGPSITAGEIAEALLFYQNVHIVLDYSSLVGLIKTIGMRLTLRVLSLPDVNATYIEEITGTRTDQSLLGPEYSLIAFMLTGDTDVARLGSRKMRLEHVLKRNGYGKSDAKQLTERFRRSVRFKKLGDDYYIKGGLISAAWADILDTAYVDNASRIVAQNLLENVSLPSNFFFKVHAVGDKFRVNTNFDFQLASQIQKAKNPNAGKLTPAHISTELLNASIGLVFAGHYGGDFYTSETESRIIDSRQRFLLHRFQRDRSELGHFREVVLQGSPSIADAINSGARSFEEFLELLSAARKFKHWLKCKSPDESLVASYLEDVTALGWLSRIPGKAFRYVIGAVAGAIDPVSGLTVSAGDAFLLEKLTGGWRPNHFIASKVKPFVQTDDLELR